MKPKRLLWLIIALTIISSIIALPKNYPLKISFGPVKIDQVISSPDIDVSFGNFKIHKEIFLHLGLDLQGGTHLVLEADMKDINPPDRTQALDSARGVIERRVNFYGLTEPVVQSAKVGENYRIIVELPGIKDKDKAIAEIGQTAKLEFREWIATQAAETGISGKDLKKAAVEFDPNTGAPYVAIEFTNEGGKKFGDLTTRLVNQRMPIFLDQRIISDPVVQEPITGGRGRITGQFTIEEARKLARQLNAGALPVPIKVLEERSIGATLGQESVQKSLRAGAIGLALVALFMWLYYGRLGFLADLALAVYGLLSLAIFKLLPVTLTLPGIAGFILSIGMAVDANILIFERTREELRSGKPWQQALELGFGRAWDSIRDANFTTLITCFILFNPMSWSFLPSFGMVRGFALTLAIGVLTSLFTGIIVTRTLLRVFYKPKNTRM
ncbi:protein translocase subunit SecD [Candidatus Gottesmanbacteria bacterium]|nr:protein translocase subunit SecD [Candidatus Gottesmanbacteria bacterium]MBI5465449.1 protein translocase subunit SecD [Candidatus Gottesmanbacteria bacterium]